MIFRPSTSRAELAFFFERFDDDQGEPQPYAVHVIGGADADRFAGLFPRARRVTPRKAVALGFTAPRRAARAYDYFPGSFTGEHARDPADWKLDQVIEESFRASTAEGRWRWAEANRRAREDLVARPGPDPAPTVDPDPEGRPCSVLITDRRRPLIRCVGARRRKLKGGRVRLYPGRLTSNGARAFAFVDEESARAWIAAHPAAGAATIAAIVFDGQADRDRGWLTPTRRTPDGR